MTKMIVDLIRLFLMAFLLPFIWPFCILFGVIFLGIASLNWIFNEDSWVQFEDAFDMMILPISKIYETVQEICS